MSRRIRIHPAAVAVWALFLGALVLAPRLMPDEAAMRSAFLALGPLAPFAFVAAEVVQVVVIPIPGQPLEIPGGWLFGLGWGIALGSAGAFAGSFIAFRLGRRYGRPWVEARVNPDVRRRFEARWTKSRPSGTRPGDGAGWVIFWLMMIPAFPRDPLCYLAGVSRLSTARFALIAAIGRPVGLAPWVALGAEGVRAGIELQVLMIAAAGVVWFVDIGHRRWRRRRLAERDRATHGGKAKARANAAPTPPIGENAAQTGEAERTGG